MKTLIALTALLGGLALLQQASACDWMHQADQKPATTATCENGNCPADQQAQAEAATTETAAPAAPQAAEAPAPDSATVVASGK
jgi:hypothetical protein